MARTGLIGLWGPLPIGLAGTRVVSSFVTLCNLLSAGRLATVLAMDVRAGCSWWMLLAVSAVSAASWGGCDICDCLAAS
jgi:hypothetical protein